MKLEKRKNLVLVAIILAIITVCTMSYAATATYYSDGTIETITTDKGTITFYSDGIVEKIETPTGTATYYSDGTLDSIDGTVSISLEEAKLELEKMKKINANDSKETSKPNFRTRWSRPSISTSK